VWAAAPAESEEPVASGELVREASISRDLRAATASAAIAARSEAGVACQDFQSKVKNWWSVGEPSRVRGTGGNVVDIIALQISGVRNQGSENKDQALGTRKSC
jgi:hypothetical protein